MRRCKNCKYYRPCEKSNKRGKCIHPKRDDIRLVHYFGGLKETDYCTLYDGGSKDDVQEV